MNDYYILNPNSIEAGDILLTNQPQKQSYVIRKVTKGLYSHASIALDQFCFIEAVGDGVTYFSSVRFAFKSTDSFCILRLKENKDVNFNKEISEAARRYSFRDYDLKGAIKAGFKKKSNKSVNTSEKRTFYCSQLVATIYKDINIQLFNDSKVDITPSDLEKCDKLIDVTKKCIKKVEFEEELLGKDIYEEKDHTETTLHIEAKIVKKMYKQIQPEFISYSGIDPIDFEDSLNKLKDVKDKNMRYILDGKIDTIINNSGYLNLLERHSSIALFFYYPDKILETEILNKQIDNNRLKYIENIIKNQIKSLNEIIDFHSKNRDVCRKNYFICPLKTQKTITELYTKIVTIFEKTLENNTNALKLIQNNM